MLIIYSVVYLDYRFADNNNNNNNRLITVPNGILGVGRKNGWNQQHKLNESSMKIYVNKALALK